MPVVLEEQHRSDPADPAGPAAPARPPVEEPPATLNWLRRNTWALADQILISGTNFVTMVLTARGLHSEERFGEFSLVYSVLLFFNGLQTALIVQPHNVLGTTRVGEAYRRYTTATALGQLALVAVGAVMALGAAGVGFIGQWAIAPMLLALAAAIVAWQLQEFVRRVLYTEGRLAAAFWNDLLSYGGQGIIIALLWWNHRVTGELALYALAATSAAATLLGAWQIRGSLSRQADRGGLRDNWRFGRWLAGAEVLGWCSSLYMYTYLVAIFTGTRGAGEMKAAQTLFGPTRVLSFFLANILPMRFARTLAAHGNRGMHGQMVRVSTFVAPIMGVYCLAVALAARPLLKLVYGPAYVDATPVLILYAGCAFITYMQMILAAALTARQVTRSIFLGSVYGGAISVAGGWLFIATMGVPGAIVGMIVTAIVVSAYYWLVYRRHVIRGEAEGGADALATGGLKVAAATAK